jgi:transporter family-2 protein
MLWFYAAVALGAGLASSMQAGVNALFVRYAGHVMAAAFLSFVVGTASLGVYMLATRTPLPSWGQLSQTPLLMFSGGVLGALFVASSIFAAPKLGAALLIAFIIAGQMLGSILLDHFGLLGFPEHPVNLWRLVGVACLIAGVILIRIF